MKNRYIYLIVVLFLGIGGYWGVNALLSSENDIMITPKLVNALSRYDQIDDFHEGLARVCSDGNYGYIDTSGEEVIPCIYSYEAIFSEGLAAVEKDGKWGFVDREGKIVIPFEYEWAAYFVDGLAPIGVKDDNYFQGKKGYINKNGEMIISPTYSEASVFHNGYALVEKNDKYGFVDKRGNEVIPCEWDNATWFSEGLAAVVKGEKLGFINNKGEEVIPCQYEEYDGWYWDISTSWFQGDRSMAYHRSDDFPRQMDLRGCFADGLVSVVKNGKYGVIDKNGNEIIPFEYDKIGYFSEGIAKAMKEKKYGFIDTEGNAVIPFKYDVAKDFSEGMACVGQYEKIQSAEGYEDEIQKSGYVDKQGNEVVPCKYATCYCFDFHHGIAMMVLEGVIYTYNRCNADYETLQPDIIGYADKLGRVTFTQDDYDKIAKADKKYREEIKWIEEQRIAEQRRWERAYQETEQYNSGSYSNSNPNDYSSPYSTDEGRQAYIEVQQLQQEARRLIDKSAPYRSIMKSEVYGSYNYQTARMQNMDILDAAIAKLQSARSIAKNKLHDESLVRELDGQMELLNKAKYSD